MGDQLSCTSGFVGDPDGLLLLNSAFIASLHEAQKALSDNQDAVIVPSPKAATSGVYLTPVYLNKAYEHLSDAPIYVKLLLDRILDYSDSKGSSLVRLDLTPFTSPEDFLDYLVKLLPYNEDFVLGDKVYYWFGQLHKDGTLYAVFAHDRWKDVPLVVQARYLPDA